MSRLLIAVLVFAACGSGSSAVERKGETTTTTKPATEKKDSCRDAQATELETWLAEMVTTPDDELEMFTTLGMILTLTDPETLAEIRDANPETAKAADASENAWRACGETERVNCATLARVMTTTETRLETKIWDHSAIDARCWSGELEFENADCALAASEIESANACF